ncbi:MAG: uracil-xanthine permease family protein [Xenococcaceae cyanobacterium]
MTRSNSEVALEDIQAQETEQPKVAAQLIYGLNDKPPLIESIFVAFQHVLAAFVGIITPPLIIGTTLELPPTETSYLVSMSLFVSGIATFLQVKKFGPVGSGLLSLQGTSFAFLGSIVGVGSSIIQGGGSPQAALARIFGVCFFGAFVQIIFSRFLHLARKIISPIVSGTVVMIIGLSLIKTGIISMAGGVAAQKNGTFASPQNLALSGLVLLTIIIFSVSSNRYLRMGAIAIGLVVGYIASFFLGLIDFSIFSKLPIVSLPIPLRYGMSFDFASFVPFIFLYLLTSIETIGDLTATSAITKQPVEGSLYMRRIKGGILGDGINCLMAAVFNTFPVTTFSQNNGVIQMTGVGSRYVGFFIAGILSLLGLVPIVGGIFQSLPQSVLGGATVVMFGAIAVAGINIITSVELDRRGLIIVAVSLALGLGVVYVPEIFDGKPALVENIFASATSTGGLAAVILNWLLPHNMDVGEKSIEPDV